MRRCLIVACLAVTVIACEQRLTPSSPSTSLPSDGLPPPREIIKIAVGESVRVTVGPGDPIVWNEFLDEWTYRVVHVVTNKPVRVEVQVAADDSGRADWMIRNYTCCNRITSNLVDIPANTELEIEIRNYTLGPARVTRTYTVSTRLVGF